MLAVVIHRTGGPEVLELEEWPDPTPAADEVVIGVRAVTVGRTLDVEARARGADFHAKLPRVPGSDPAGVVIEAGSAVSRFAPGDRVVCTSTLFCGACAACRAGETHACVDHRVVGVHTDGGDAERVAVPQGSVEPIPEGVGFEEAAAMAVSYPVAWNLLARRARVQQGERVLVMGAAGGLGIAGVLVARTLGAHVIAGASSERKLEQVRALLGPDETVDYSRPGWAEAVADVGVVFENIASPGLFEDALGTLAPYGRLVTCGAHGGGVVALDVRRLYRRRLSVIGDTGASVGAIREVFAAVAGGKLPPPPVSHRFPLREVAAAHEAAAGRELFGRAILTI
ncbi:MAG TPA: alcohol dehydrogenase catalytic domain-containing protein [Solirubrobacteraceae bacterium]|jgi:NADPH:quinone reductase-like Zn-dependent oxidoreductase|nr:alcohol dehydrogenase catalytic domain-containing protein [Solirubrobacteraceae bacterium]